MRQSLAWKRAVVGCCRHLLALAPLWLRVPTTGGGALRCSDSRRRARATRSPGERGSRPRADPAAHRRGAARPHPLEQLQQQLQADTRLACAWVAENRVRIAELRAHRLAQLRECLEPLEVWNEQFQSQAPRHIRESAVPMANMIEVSRVQQEQKRSIGRDACSCGALARERCSARTRCGCQRGGGACFAEAHSMGLASA